VLENVRLAVQSRRHEGLSLFAVWLDRRETLGAARALVERVRLGDRADAAASSLPHGDQRKLEVAMLIALEPSVYMFDEPTAGMSVDDVPVILDLIRSLKAEADKTILLVEHKMDVVRELADRIIVLHNGQLVADGEPAAVIASPIVQQAYLGLAPARRQPRPSASASRGQSRGRRRMTRAAAAARRRAHAHRRVPHPARRRLRGAGRQVTMLLGRNGAGKTTTCARSWACGRRRRAR
jgi:ABC-type branched-subunit amino acid transport system ATPase component